jgi:hypothetical protein
MKTKIASVSVLAIALAAILTSTPVHGSFIATIYAWTDKSSYVPGDSGVLHITVRNTGTQAFTVRNITVDYPWMAFVTDHWDGNFTTANINNAVAAGQNYNTQYSFTVPTDGRASFFGVGTASITVGTDIGSNGSYQDGTARITMALPAYQPLSLTSSILPIITIVLLGIAVVMLALVWMGISKQKK